LHCFKYYVLNIIHDLPFNGPCVLSKGFVGKSVIGGFSSLILPITAAVARSLPPPSKNNFLYKY